MSPQDTSVGKTLSSASVLFGHYRVDQRNPRKVVCDVCGDSSLGPEDHTLEGAEVAVLSITKSGEFVSHQAFRNSKGVYKVAETMPESERWESVSTALVLGTEAMG